jgi:hypothetical protein
MISLELAKKLKDAGLKWEPETGDGFRNVFMETDHFITYRSIDRFKSITHTQEYTEKNDFVWLPSLSQLLAEIEGRGYEWSIGKVGNLYLIGVKEVSPIRVIPKTLRADTPEDAAAGALIWILEREKDGN